MTFLFHFWFSSVYPFHFLGVTSGVPRESQEISTSWDRRLQSVRKPKAQASQLHKKELKQTQKSQLHPRISELAPTTGWLLGATPVYTGTWYDLASISYVRVLFKQHHIKILSPSSKKDFLKLWRDNGLEGKWGGGWGDGRKCLERHFGMGKSWKCEYGRERKENQLRDEKIARELHLGKVFGSWNNSSQEGRIFLFSDMVVPFLHLKAAVWHLHICCTQKEWKVPCLWDSHSEMPLLSVAAPTVMSKLNLSPYGFHLTGSWVLRSRTTSQPSTSCLQGIFPGTAHTRSHHLNRSRSTPQMEREAVHSSRICWVDDRLLLPW